ncbi:MAG: PAS domain S-box protein, partial [Promethearchaeota archaeon]
LIDLEGKSLILASGDDITRSKVTEKKIKESEEKYRLLFENMVEGFAYHKIITDKNGTPINYTFVDVNPAFETFSGLKRDDLIGKKVTEVFPRIENDPVDWIGKFGKVALTGNPLHFEEYFEAYNRWYGISAYSPKKGFFVIVFIDITDRKQAEQKLKASEEKYRKLFESSPIGIGISDMDGNVHEINKVMEKITAFTLEDFQKMKIKSTYVNLEDRIEVMKILKENGEVRDFEVKLKRKGGSAYDALMNITKIKIENKELFLTNIRDITDFKKANIELKESEKKYRSLFENTTEGLALYEVISDEMEKPLDFTCLEVNSVFEEITGSKSRDIVGKKITELLPGIRNDLSNWFEKIGNDALGGKSLHIEYFSRNYNLWLSISAYSPMKRFVVVIMRDITKRKKAEQDLKESEEKFRTIFEQANDSILLLDENLIILDCNRKTSEKFGFNNAMELIGKTLIDLSPEMQPGGTRSEKQLSEFFKQVFMDKLHNFYWLQKRKDGSCFDSEVSTNVLSIEGNIRVQMIVHDITEHIEAERLIREENKKLVQLQKTRNNLINRISHELKTPLISIKGFSDYLLQIHSVGLNDEIKSSLEDIKAGVKRMETVIEKFLETNYLESPHFKLVREKSDLHDLIHLCISSLRGYARLRNLEIFQNLTGKLKINIDKKKITEVLTNILINAIKFTPPDGKIFLTTSTQNGSVLVSIRDTGIGFTNKELGQIFAQFGKIERFGKGWDIVTEGSGLGLYISKLIINAHGGKIWVESEGRNKGSTFYFTIPLKNT